MGKIFTGGQNNDEMFNICSDLNKKGLNIVFFYSNEPIPGYTFTNEVNINILA